MNILQINSSARSEGSQSTAVAERIVARLKAENAGKPLSHVRDLASDPHPALDQAALGALFTPAESRTPEQAARVALDDKPRSPRSRPPTCSCSACRCTTSASTSQLKNWIDSICRAKVTFQYTENGPEGLLKGKKAYVALARGGKHQRHRR